MPPSTVKVRLHRGRKKLKELLMERGYSCACAVTDLLDGWEDGSVELPPPAGMSPERIKERTMEKIRQTKRPRRRMGVRLLACAALAAVFTVSAMAAYHLWGPGELFDPFFTLRAPR